MGLFDAKYVTTVGTQVSRVIDDKLLPNSVKTGVIKGLFAEDGGDLVDYIVDEMTSSIGSRMERMFDYAQTAYTYGLPRALLHDATQGRAEIQAVLDGIEGQPVVTEYLHYGTPNYLHVGWAKLISDYGYNTATNEIVRLTNELDGGPVYLKDMVVIHPNVANIEKAALEQWGISPKAGPTPQRRGNTGPARELVGYTDPQMDLSATVPPRVRVDYVWVLTAIPQGGVRPIDTIMEGSLLITLDGFNEDLDYFHAKYHVGSVDKYWMYQSGAGTYTSLDNIFNVPVADEANGTFFPWLYFRYNKQNVLADKTTDAYKSSKKMAKYLGMNFDQVADGINQNPDIADVEQAMMISAVPANTTVEIERRYLFQFFGELLNANMMDISAGTVQGDIREMLADDLDITKFATVIRDNRFTMVLTHGGLYKSRKVGQVAALGSHDSGFAREFITRDFPVYGETGEVQSQSRDIPVEYHYFRKQVSTNIYEELQVVNLKTRFYVFEGYYTLGDDDAKILLIPVDRSLTQTYTLHEKELLYGRSLHFVFNSRVVTKLSWYQQEWFGDLITIVGVVLSVWSFGADGGAFATLANALTTAGVSSAIIAVAAWSLISSVFEGLIMSVALKQFVKALGIKFAFLLAIVSMVTATLVQFDVISLPGAPWAKDLLSLGTNLTKGITGELKDMFTGLSTEAKEFDLLAKERTKLLETGQELLDGNNHLLSPLTIIGEKPDDFYNRTVHSGNIGVLGIEAIHSYVDIALKLPEIEDTIGGLK